MKAQRAPAQDGPVTPSASKTASRWRSLKKWQGVFLDEWLANHDRLQALASAGKQVGDLDEAMEKDEKFFNAYDQVEREIVMGLEDSQVKSAMTGKNAGAQKLALETYSTRYQKKPNAAKRGRTQSGGRVSGVKDWSARAEMKWGAIFQSTRSEALSESAANP